MAEATTDLIEAFGGTEVLGKQAGQRTLPDLLREGLPFQSLLVVLDDLHLEPEYASWYLHLSRRTWQRMKKEKQPLDREQSNLLYRLVRMGHLATAAVGDREKALLWMRKPNRALGGSTPLQMLDTDPGAQLVEDVLTRIYGDWRKPNSGYRYWRDCRASVERYPWTGERRPPD